MLTRWWNFVLKLAASGWAKLDLAWQGWIAIPLTVRKPEHISYRKVPVLCYHFRKKELCCRGKRTARKIANTIMSSKNAVQEVVLPAYPMISFRAKHIRPYAGKVINLVKDYTDDVTYLVRQCQQEVIGEDGGDRK
jgi:hypothetical protein